MAASAERKLTVEVVYAQPRRLHVLSVEVAEGTSIREAIVRSGLPELCPEIDLVRNSVGIFGEVLAPDTPVHDRCRIEIYRPLLADPKDARRRRART